MATSRREFLTHAAAVGSIAGLGGPLLRRMFGQVAGISEGPKPLRILILGGTGFLGPQLVDRALARGHTLTLFNRGRTNPRPFPDVEKIQGDRDGDLAGLRGRAWDAVIDTSATLPRRVRRSAQLLKDAAGQYVFVSSISVYADFSRPGITEESAVGTLDDPTVERVTDETFGPLKALAEREAERAFPGRTTVVRPGLTVGPGDPSDRFTYWAARVDGGGEVLAPGRPGDPVQILDVRDLGAWIVRLVEDRVFGVVHATGPGAPLSIAELLSGMRAVTPADVSFTWVDADFLAEQKVRPWSDLPVWRPPRDGMEGFARVDSRKAITAGLAFRPLADTARDTLEWFRAQPPERQARTRAGLAADREAGVVAAWHARGG